MDSPPTVAVAVTDARYAALTHQPSGLPVTERWPADAFTFRLRDDGAIRIVPDEPESDPGNGVVDPTPATTRRKV